MGALIVALGAVAGPAGAADLWGGSLGLTSDYIVRGVSRSDDRAALQLDLHYLDSSGFAAGLFASDARIDGNAPHDVELSGFLGFAWSAGEDLNGRLLASHYSYPETQNGYQYHYDEVDLDLTYRGWVQLSLSCSPNTPDYLPTGQTRHVSAETAEIGLHHTLIGRLSGVVGVGYYFLSGPYPSGYGFGSAALAYDLAPLSLSVTYVKTTTEANSLFYDTARGGRWIGTVIWRF